MTKKVDKLIKTDINQLFMNSNLEDVNPILALVFILDKLIDNFESKDIVPRNMAKAFALVGNTNKVQKDLIKAIIKKSNDDKGKAKLMYYEIITNTLKSIRNTGIDNDKGLLGRIINR
jgi:hypothetical protein